eukprot:980425-Pyramimonas_sp.AAC.1
MRSSGNRGALALAPLLSDTSADFPEGCLAGGALYRTRLFEGWPWYADSCIMFHVHILRNHLESSDWAGGTRGQ